VLKSKGLQSKQDNETFTQRSELFLRARVVRDDQEDDLVPTRRILVRYPKGSTYQVKRSNLIPVLEPLTNNDLPVVLIMAETPDYRRAAVVHTCLGDSFLEIGCDYGACVNRVQRALHDVRSVPQNPQDEPMNLDGINRHCHQAVSVLQVFCRRCTHVRGHCQTASLVLVCSPDTKPIRRCD
jgi:hypothetical protein